MSIEKVQARISEIESRIAELNGMSVNTPAIEAGKDAVVNAPPTVSPFNVALAQANGQTQLKATGASGTLSPQIEALIAKYSTQNGLNPNVLRAVIRAESDGDPKCVSSKGAMGLMQLMPEELQGYGVRDAFDPEQNIMGGARQLAQKIKAFNGELPLALAAYNAGTGAVKKYGGIPPYRETQNYVNKIMEMLR